MVLVVICCNFPKKATLLRSRQVSWKCCLTCCNYGVALCAQMWCVKMSLSIKEWTFRRGVAIYSGSILLLNGFQTQILLCDPHGLGCAMRSTARCRLTLPTQNSFDHCRVFLSWNTKFRVNLPLSSPDLPSFLSEVEAGWASAEVKELKQFRGI